MILVPANKVEKIKYFSTLGLIFIEITRGPFMWGTNKQYTISSFVYGQHLINIAS